MLGDDVRADFFVFEYFQILQNSEAKIQELARRVRQRFPDGTL